ncbi:NAD(P)/FAD-dependent oxidoreductase [Streptomyces sp. B-S-A8]|uniref:NAD(P)/FAD-dependent oxidoreductase n=1 Tax=Streptomyces solicavernae TaxID=3043614 RepID=A0ABT6RXK3_9ACTN|nr:NAD(P)/FAD-dependent oxidoreductase [Streptomyces sp. B-S-A8]MDI3389176.1 NAD(P)/FAD-dependent oxidoreductase [Streptomyces sp. B-S-A8]
MKDVVIVGGGIAGLSAAWRLRHWDTLLLESEGRVGGRIRSERRGPYFLNWGGHVYAGGNSATGWLLNNTGVEAIDVPGSLSGLSMNGRTIMEGRVETYPFRIPMPLQARIGMVRTGAKVALQVARYSRIVGRRKGETAAERQQRIYEFLNDRSFKDFIGDVPADTQALFEPTVTRSAADIDQLSAGAGVGYFSLVWGIGGGLTQSIVGGPSTLTESIAASLGGNLRLDAHVDEIAHKKDSVVVRYRENGVPQEVQARTVVLATPATVAHRVAVDLDPDIREALSKVAYGPYVSAAFLSNETGRQRWDDAYAIATPKRSFNVALNMSNIVRGHERERQPGSSLMTFSPGSLARGLLDHDDDTVRRIYLDDLDQVLPGFADHVVEAEVQRFPTGAPYCFPGRAELQPALTRRGGRVFLAGDYLGTLYTETAISSGLSAATEIRSILATDRQTARRTLSSAA